MDGREIKQKVFYLIFLSTIVSVWCDSQFENLGIDIRLERIECKINSTMTIITICEIKFVSRNVANLNLGFKTYEQTYKLKYHMKFYYQFDSNMYRPFLIDVWTDYCATMSGKANSIIQGTVLNIIGNHTNWNVPCPLSPGHFYITDFNAEAKQLPILFPAGRYRMNVNIYANENSNVSLAIYFTITNKGILDLAMGK